MKGEREEASGFNLVLDWFANCLANKFMHINYISNEKYLQMHLFAWQRIDWACRANINHVVTVDSTILIEYILLGSRCCPIFLLLSGCTVAGAGWWWGPQDWRGLCECRWQWKRPIVTQWVIFSWSEGLTERQMLIEVWSLPMQRLARCICLLFYRGLPWEQCSEICLQCWLS